MDPDGNFMLRLVILLAALFLKAFIMCSKTSIAVSYTHLDVYKRQP